MNKWKINNHIKPLSTVVLSPIRLPSKQAFLILGLLPVRYKTRSHWLIRWLRTSFGFTRKIDIPANDNNYLRSRMDYGHYIMDRQLDESLVGTDCQVPKND